MKQCIIVVSVLVLASLTNATTISVPGDQPTIQGGIVAAIPGDTVLVSPGTYEETVNFLGKDITVLSAGGYGVTVIQPFGLDSPIDIPMMTDSSAMMSTDATSTVSFVNSETEGAVLDGFTINNPSGYGIYCSGSSPVIQNCDISECYNGSDGAGIWCNNSGAKILNNVIHHNFGGATGGGIGGRGSAPLEIAYNTIYENSAANGAGIGFPSGTANLNVHHNVVRNNISSNYLGGIYINGSNSDIINNTVVGNSVSGISILDGAGINIFNNIVVSNDGDGTSLSGAFADYNDVWSNTGTNLPGPNGISEDPLFVDAINHDYHLQETSPCIDAGDPDPIYADPDGSRNDMGAYYYQQSCCQNSGDIDHDGTVWPTDLVYFVDWLWRDGAEPPCIEEADVDGSGDVNPQDCLYLVNYMWNSGPAPVPCP